MKYYQTYNGVQIPVISDLSLITFPELVDNSVDTVKLHSVTLLMDKGLSKELKIAAKDKTISNYINSKLSSAVGCDATQQVKVYTERDGVSNFGIFQISLEECSLALFLSDTTYSKEELSDRNKYSDVLEEVSEIVYSNKKKQEQLINYIKKLYKTICKYEDITDIAIGSYTETTFIDDSPDLDYPYTKLTIQELASMWNMSDANIRMAIKENKFDKNDIEKRAGIWFITLDGMTKVFKDYSLYSINQMKKGIKETSYNTSEYSRTIKAALKQLNVPFDKYSKFKWRIIQRLKEKEIGFIRNIICLNNDTENQLELNKIIKENNYELYLDFFNKWFSGKEKQIAEARLNIDSVYFEIDTNTANNPIDNKYSRKFSSKYADMDYDDGNYAQYTRDISLDIYGITEEEMKSVYDEEGGKIGTLIATFYNIEKIFEDDREEELPIIMDDRDQESSDVYSAMVQANEHDMATNGMSDNILFIKWLNLKKEFRTDKTRKLVMQKIQNDFEFLYDQEVGCIMISPYEATENKEEDLGIIKCYKSIGFNEVKFKRFSLLWFNTDYRMEEGLYEIEEPQEEKYTGKTVKVGTDIFKEVKNPLTIYADFGQWCCEKNGVTITINCKKNISINYEVYNPLSGIIGSLYYPDTKKGFKQAAQDALAQVPDYSIEDIKPRKGSKIKLKLRCIKDYYWEDQLEFKNGETYRAKDDGYELVVQKDNSSEVIATDYEGKWERDKAFKEHFEIIK